MRRQWLLLALFGIWLWEPPAHASRIVRVNAAGVIPSSIPDLISVPYFVTAWFTFQNVSFSPPFGKEGVFGPPSGDIFVSSVSFRIWDADFVTANDPLMFSPTTIHYAFPGLKLSPGAKTTQYHDVAISVPLWALAKIDFLGPFPVDDMWHSPLEAYSSYTVKWRWKVGTGYLENSSGVSGDTRASLIPEPASVLLVGLPLAGLCLALWRRRDHRP